MVDVSAKPETERAATARARVRMTTATAQAVAAGNGPKGDVVAVARLAAIQAAKRTDELIPLAHSLPLSSADADVAVDAEAGIVTVTCTRDGRRAHRRGDGGDGGGVDRRAHRVRHGQGHRARRRGRAGRAAREARRAQRAVAQGGGHDVVIDIGEAYDRIGANARPLPGETVPLADAAGRVLSAEVLGAVDLPGFDRSSMDGWAVRSEDFASPPVSLPVRGDVAAGSAGDVPLEAGTAVVISTGAPMPPGSDAVLPLEDGEQTDGVLTSSESVRPKAFVRFRGEDVRAGELLVPAGRAADARAAVRRRVGRRRGGGGAPAPAGVGRRDGLRARAAGRAAAAGRDLQLQRPDPHRLRAGERRGGAAAAQRRRRPRQHPRRARRGARGGRRRARLRRRVGGRARPREGDARGPRRRGALLARPDQAGQADLLRPPRRHLGVRAPRATRSPPSPAS